MHKLKYFKKQGWDGEWIDTVEEIICKEFKRNYTAYTIHKSQKALHPSKKVSAKFLNYKYI